MKLMTHGKWNCAMPRCPYWATERVGVLWYCGEHTTDVLLHGQIMRSDEQLRVSKLPDATLLRFKPGAVEVIVRSDLL